MLKVPSGQILNFTLILEDDDGKKMSNENTAEAQISIYSIDSVLERLQG